MAKPLTFSGLHKSNQDQDWISYDDNPQISHMIDTITTVDDCVDKKGDPGDQVKDNGTKLTNNRRSVLSPRSCEVSGSVQAKIGRVIFGIGGNFKIKIN